MKATIYTHEGDSQEELEGIKRKLEKEGIEYKVYENIGPLSESYVPIVQVGERYLDGEQLEGEHQLFLHLYHKK